MRISTSWAHQTSVNSMLNQQARLQQIQMQLSSGKKLLTPSDDPIAAGRVIDLKQSIAENEQYQSTIDSARNHLSMEEGVLKSAGDVLQRLNELGIQGLNDANSASDRAAIADEMDQLGEQLLGLANTQTLNGDYMFGGFKNTSAPFSKDTGNPGAYTYAGDSNLRSVQIDKSRQIVDNDIGSDVFGMPTGTTGSVPAPGSINNIFEAIDKFSADLRANQPNSGSLDDIKRSLDKVINVRSSVGVRLNALDRQEEINGDTTLEMQSILSQTEDLDYADAISQFSQQSVSLQAAQQTFSQVKKLTLFNYL